MKIKIKTKSQSLKSSVKPVPSSRNLLYGTGLTKALAKKQIVFSNKPKISLQSSSSLETIAIKQKLIIPESTKQTNALSIKQKEVAILQSSSLTDGITLDKDQIHAKNNIINQKYAILIGSAGTGKTTTLKAILSTIEPSISYHLDKDDNEIPSIAFCAFMGKAVQQMKRAIPKKYHSVCKTIHATLEFKPTMIDDFDENGEIISKMQFLPEYTEHKLLQYDYICIDEVGTLSVSLWHYLLAAIKPSCRIILLGDLNQLTPVAGHSILGFALLKWPSYELTVLHRNAGAIAENAHRVIKGLLPETDKITNKVAMRKISDGSITARKELLSIIRYLHEKNKFDPLLDAIIVPQNKDILGQEQLNEVLVNQFNPTAKRISIKAGNIIKVFGVGDKIMLLKNNNQLNLTNGMQGVIISITPNNNFKGSHIDEQKEFANVEMDLDKFDAQFEQIAALQDENAGESPAERAGSHVVTIQFQDIESEISFSTVGDLSNITLSYVFTCHKAQGSEYRFVIVLCHSANKVMLSREWLYTAMTRAKESLLILSNHRGIAHAVGTQRIKGITMKEKADKFIALCKAKKGEAPAKLPEAETITQIKLNFK